jgi:tetratricopeptide (TPR) repeat protein
MILRRNFMPFALILCVVLLLQSGCAPKVPPAVEAPQSLSGRFQVGKKIRSKVGVYVSGHERDYILNRQMMGTSFPVEIGKSLVPVSMQMATAMFDAAKEVNSLPPYPAAEAPDVEAVLEPEIIYADASAEGTVSGQVEVKVKLRMKAYDLSGKVIWVGEGFGSKRSEQLGFWTTFAYRRDKVREVGLQACVLAAQEITKAFNTAEESELRSLPEMETLAQEGTLKGATALQLADKLYQKGLHEFDRKRFEYALRAFQKAERLNPEDLGIKFYVGICKVYTGQRSSAIEDLKFILAQKRTAGNLTLDSKKWMLRLNDSLKIGLVFTGSEESFPDDLRRRYTQALAACGMYDIVDVQNAAVSESLMDGATLKKVLAEGDKKKAKVVIFVDGKSFETAIVSPGLKKGDEATEFGLTADVRAYGTKTAKMVSSFLLTETHALMNRDGEGEASAIYGTLARRSAARVVLSLLESEIF